MKRIMFLAVGLAAMTACNMKGQTIPAFDPNFASADWTVLGKTNHEECGIYVFVDWQHLFVNQAAGTSGGDISSMIAGLLPSAANAPEAQRALYHALEKMPEATHLLEPRIHTHWTGFGMVPFAFGKRFATVDAHGVRIGDRPVPNAQ